MQRDRPWLSEREAKLPQWAQEVICNLRCDQINREMSDCVQADIRRLAKRVLGGNCTFSDDDDAHLLAGLAELAIDAGLHEGKITDKLTLADIERAKVFREQERAAIAMEARQGQDREDGPDAEHDSAAIAQTPSGKSL